jgi:hypothetical protein
MTKDIKITKDEILERPNDFDLGSYVRSKLDEDDYDYDRCVICGKITPYLKTTNINLRVGYVEGGGQGCFQSKKCEYNYDPY